MMAAAATNEYRHNPGPDFTAADAHGAEYPDDVEDVGLMNTEQRQALNAAMAEWYGIS